MVRIPTHGAPTHPGETLQEEFLKPLGLSQSSWPRSWGSRIYESTNWCAASAA